MITEPTEIIVCFTQVGKLAHGLHVDCKTALGPWVKFSSGDVLERALVHLGATEEQIQDYRDTIRRWGQGSTHITLQPGRKNLLNLDWSKV